ncbi:hypothetical protein O181_011753 [Austropuccinia psidii MF-1]|uniref:Dienelactone hydrolase domain-containing protein n=1 Tax=Austropuccinia psidii MF-1 TaxID=1389203 RepID=A0A9Q3BVG3_9BASI|nr:hypothetical protein [Austropuccinia psidii MF-1]
MACGEQCISLFIHEGKPSGTFSTLNGVRVYVATPPNPTPHKAILISPDIYGVDLKNTQLLADRFAKDVNVPTYLIDTLGGNTVAEPGKQPENFSLLEWIQSNPPTGMMPYIEKVIEHLKGNNISHFAVAGYCYGGKHVLLMSQLNWVQVAAAFHPSLLEIPGDIEKLLSTGKVPLLINSCETDAQFPINSQKITDGILGDGKYKPGYKRTYYHGATHGFGCRADLNNELEKKAFDESYKETVEWFKKYL